MGYSPGLQSWVGRGRVLKDRRLQTETASVWVPLMDCSDFNFRSGADRCQRKSVGERVVVPEMGMVLRWSYVGSKGILKFRFRRGFLTRLHIGAHRGICNERLAKSRTTRDRKQRTARRRATRLRRCGLCIHRGLTPTSHRYPPWGVIVSFVLAPRTQLA